MNRLAREKSPYLLQHANNPVNWYPWSEEAFLKAINEDKPIFLSIGYSTCHWCHVMEKESFENETIASLMNDTFISIKVDREERPDIDNIYMNICQILTGSGGWPLTIVMTPDKKPFFAGTYFPKENSFGRSGMKELIPRIKDIWLNRRNEVENSAINITSSLSVSASYDDKKLSPEIFNKAYNQLLNRFDTKFGGFNRAPKFPTPHNFYFLLRYWKNENSPEALEMVIKTLKEMRNGGIFDHIGLGFHRYSTDQEWLLPHFEKMLYDQALLSIAYTEAFQVTGDQLFKNTSEEILKYVVRSMTSEEGGFYSAEDADSEGIEGKFYLWSYDEIKKLLNEKTDLFCKIFNIKEEGNFIDQIHGNSRLNILHLKKSLEEISTQKNIPLEELKNFIINCRKILFQEREKRIHPYKDDKILTDWNALMISAFCKAAQVFNKNMYMKYAEKAADFILNKMRDKGGRLLHRYREGEAAISGFLDDYAFFISALIDLYETNFDIKYLKSAVELNDIVNKHFLDNEKGGYFFTADDSEEILVRQKDVYDGAVPSGNSIALANLFRLYKITSNESLRQQSDLMIKYFAGSIDAAPIAYTQFLSSLYFAFGSSYEILITANSKTEKAEKFLGKIYNKFLPNKVILFKSDDELEKISPFTTSYKFSENKVVVYLCENYNCNLPVDTLEQLEDLLLQL